MALIIEGNAVYEIDDECRNRKIEMQEKESGNQEKEKE